MSTVHEPAAEEPPSRAPRNGFAVTNHHVAGQASPSENATPATQPEPSWIGYVPAGPEGRGASGASSQPAHPWRSKNPFDSFRHAVEGVAHTFRTQRNMRFHVGAFLLVLFSGLLFRLSGTELLLLLFSVALVLCAEMFNTAVEAVVDMITQNYNPAAKFAKDVAAGAVLIASLNAVAVGAVLFLGSGRPQAVRLRLEEPPAFYIFFAGVLLLFCLLMVWKILGAKGTLLSGGVVSGHSAVAFFLATTVLFFADNWLVSAFAFLLAALVAQSRVEARIHTVREVLIGAMLAVCLSAGIYRLPSWVARLMPADTGHAPGVVRPALSAAPHGGAVVGGAKTESDATTVTPH